MHERVKYFEESGCLVARPVFVDGYEDVLIPNDRPDTEERCQEIRDDVEGVVQIDGKEIFVVVRI